MARRKAPATAPATSPDVYMVRDPYSLLGGRWLVLGPVFTGVRAVGYQPGHFTGPMMGVVDRVIHSWHLPNYPIVEEITPCASLLADVKEKMLAHGASPLAVQWIGELSPFNEEELTIMADKLTKKGAAKAPAAKTPAKGKGNPEALEKARAASEGKRAEMNAKKIKFIGKDVAVRDGSVRAELKDAAKGAKTVGDLKGVTLSNGKNISAGDVSWMLDAGVIEYT